MKRRRALLTFSLSGVLALQALPATGGAAPIGGASKAPKLATALSAQANLSPLGDFVQFNAGVVSKARGCAVRTVTIRRPATGAVLDSLRTTSPLKSGKKWSASGFGEFRSISGYVTSGETLRADAKAKQLKKGGKVKTVCKAASTTFVVP